MPWCNITVSNEFSVAEQEKVKSGLAEILAEEMGKQESGLVVTFTATFGFYRGGEPRTDAACVDLRYIGQFSLACKQNVTRRLARLLADTLSLDADRVIVVMSEVESQNWGRKSGDFS